MEETKKDFRMDLAGFIMGIASVFLWNILPIIPVLAAILSFCSIINYVKGRKQKLWQAVTGATLGVTYIIVAIFGNMAY